MTHGTQFWTYLFEAVELVDWKCLGQGKTFLTVFYWRSMNTTVDVSSQYARADLGITFRASAALLRCTLRCRLLSMMNLCLCFYFWVYNMVESIYLLCLAVSRLKGVLVTWPDSAWVKRRIGYPCLSVEFQCHSSGGGGAAHIQTPNPAGGSGRGSCGA